MNAAKPAATSQQTLKPAPAKPASAKSKMLALRGGVPELQKGDVIYIGTELYLGHGRDDFRGGLAEVSDVRQEKSKGQLTPFVRVVQQPDTLHNWKLLASEQKELRKRHGKDWAHPDPDDRPEFNDW